MHAATPAEDLLAEGPWWDDAVGTLTWVDIFGHAVRTLEPSGAVTARVLPDDVSLALPCADGRRVTAQVDRLVLDDGERLEPLCEVDAANPHTRLNDGVCDAAGRLWVGTYSTRGEPEAALYVVTPAGGVRPVLTGLLASNGVGFSPDGAVLYATDTGHGRIDRFRLSGDDVVPDGSLMVAGEGEGRPDGLAVDAEGCVWTVMWGGGALRRYAPDGALLESVATPVTFPTSVALGGPGLSTLYVTTSAYHLEDRTTEPLAGSVLALEADVPGLPVRRFG